MVIRIVAAAEGAAYPVGGSNRRRAALSADDVITVEGLGRDFGAFTAVAAVDFTVRRREIFGFLGPNGAGKTTTINMLATLLRPTRGRAVLAGHDVVARPSE